MAGQLGDLVVSLSADIARFRDDMGKANKIAQDNANSMAKAFSGVESAIGGIGAAFAAVTTVLAGGAMFKSMISTTKDVSGEITKLKNSLGISAEEASVLRVALDDVFLNADDMASASSRITKQLVKNEEAFRSLGVATRDSSGGFRSTTDIMSETNTKLLEFKEGTDRNVEGIKIYGKGWDEARKTLKLTAEAMEEGKKRAEELHLIFGDSGLKSVKEYKLAMKDIEDVTESLQVNIGMALIPELTRMAVTFGEGAAKGIPSFITGLHNVQAEVMRLAMLADKAGGTLTSMMYAVTGGKFTETGKWWKQQNDEYKARYLATEEQMQTLANLEMGLDKNGDKIKPKNEKSINAKRSSAAAASVKEVIKGLADEQKAAQNQIKEWLRIVWDTAATELATEDFGKDITKKLGILTSKNAGFTKNPAVGIGYDNFKSVAEIEADAAKAKASKQQYMDIMEAGNPLLQLNNMRTEQTALIAKWDEKEIGMASKKAEALAKIEKDYAANKEAIEARKTEALENSLSSSMAQISSMMMQGNKRQFEAGKQMAKMMIAIDTARAASAAFAGAAAAGGPWGVAMGVAAGVAAMSVGTMNMARLDSVQYQARAMGGPVAGGTSYLVGERGPEIFTPGASGQITSNDKIKGLGGQDINTTHVWQISTGVSDTVRAEIGRLMPLIESRTVGAVHRAINSGGSMSVAVGRM